jgi:hypothetical protein
MALYELTVVKLSGATEIRYTDRMPRIGGTVMIDGRRALVVSRHDDVVNENARTVRLQGDDCPARSGVSTRDSAIPAASALLQGGQGWCRVRTA